VSVPPLGARVCLDGGSIDHTYQASGVSVGLTMGAKPPRCPGHGDFTKGYFGTISPFFGSFGSFVGLAFISPSFTTSS